MSKYQIRQKRETISFRKKIKKEKAKTWQKIRLFNTGDTRDILVQRVLCVRPRFCTQTDV